MVGDSGNQVGGMAWTSALGLNDETAIQTNGRAMTTRPTASAAYSHHGDLFSVVAARGATGAATGAAAPAPSWGVTAVIGSRPRSQDPEQHGRESDDGDEKHVAGRGGVAVISEAEVVVDVERDRPRGVQRAAVGHDQGLLEEVPVADRRDHRAEQQRRAEDRDRHVPEPLPRTSTVDL